jgi:branched-chain amino acid transport system substrate-binding protein
MRVRVDRRATIGGIAALAGAVALAGSALAQEPIRIGFHVPLTGFAAGDGQSARLGAELAIEQINAEGGVLDRPLELVVYDDQAAAEQAVPLANRLLGEGVKAAISGSYSAPTRASAGVFQKAKIPYISAYAIHPDITRTGDHVFRTSFMGEVQGRAGAKLVGDIMDKQRVVLITLNNDFGQSLAQGFKEAAEQFGIEIVNEYSYGLKDRQFGSIVASVKRDDPEAIYASGYFFTAGPLVSQLRAGGVQAPIIGQEGYDTQQFLDIAKTAAEGVIITTSLDRDTEDEAMRTFIEQFEEKAGFPADMVAATTNTAVHVMADAIRRAGEVDPQKIRDALAATEDLPTATGHITFNELGEIRKTVQAQVVRDGAYHHYAVIDDPELLAPPSQ